MSDRDATPSHSGYREQLTLGARPVDAPGQPISERQAHAIATGRSTWHRRASKPISFWILALFIALMTHRWVPQSLWLLVHMVTLGLITNSIMIWSQHFTEALLKHKLPDSARPVQLARIYAFNLSVVLVMVGVVCNLYPLTLLGSCGVGLVIGWHGFALLQQLNVALPARFGVTVRYYSAACWLLPLGAVFGALLAYDALDARWYGRLLLAHEALNVLGFVGITVVGTLMTLWPTMLRTVMLPDALVRSVRALAGLCAGLGLTVAGALAGLGWLAVVGLLVYALALLLVVGLMVRTCYAKRPTDYSTMSVACGIVWLLGGVLWVAYLVAVNDFASLSLRPVTPVFVAGFLVQVLLGAMTYLLPARMGGGPAAVRRANQEFNRFAAGRLVMINLSLLVFCLPVAVTGSVVRTAASLVGAVAFFAFVPLMVRGVRASVAARKAMIAARARGEAPQPASEVLQPVQVPHLKNALIGAVTVALVLCLALAADPAARARLGASSPGGAATGQTTSISVEATADMRFTPSTVEVPAGNRLVIEVTNTDAKNAHDLTFANGATTGRISPGESATVDVGVVTENLAGWCSIVGHQAMGMTFEVIVTGQSKGQDAAASADTHHAAHSAARGALTPADIDFQGEISPAFSTRSAVLESAPAGESIEGRTVHKHTLDVQELPREIAPGVSLNAWTFNGSYLGPTLRGRVGDIFDITLINNGSMGHSVDFHAGIVSPDEVMRTIAPGESLTYRFEAVRSGIWLYHCSTMPMSAHLGAGMFGAVIIDPPDLPQVDREYLLVQSEISLTETGGSSLTPPVSGAALPAPTGSAVSEPGAGVLTDVLPANQAAPTLSMFNGHATQYLHAPLTAQVGERVRIWVLNAGPGGELSFHVVGSQFHTVYKEGGYLLRTGVDALGQAGGGAQAIDLSPAQGGFVEMVFTEPGTYTFVNHDFAAAERGARGLIEVAG